jgi:hypothetical protein
MEIANIDLVMMQKVDGGVQRQSNIENMYSDMSDRYQYYDIDMLYCLGYVFKDSALYHFYVFDRDFMMLYSNKT